jgi:hypothetical protein
MGLQSAIKTETLAYYYTNGVNPKVLLPLVISEMDVDNKQTNTRAILRPTGSARSYGVFVSAIEGLVHYGLTVGQIDKPEENFGPVLNEREAKDPKLLSALVQTMSAASGGSPISMKDLNKTKHGEPKFQLTKPGGKSLDFCFLDRTNGRGDIASSADAYMVSKLHSGAAERLPLPLAYGEGKPLPPLSLLIDRNSCLSKEKPIMNINFKTRSVEGIFAFLGELVRTELGLDSPPDPLFNPNGKPSYLFRVEQRPPSDGEISATIHGSSYVITPDPSGDDASTQVVQLLSDLLALQSNAKDLPAPNVIAVIP